MSVETGGALIALLGIIPFFVGIVALIVQAARKAGKTIPVLIICFAPAMFIAGMASYMASSYGGAFVVFGIYAVIAYLCIRKRNNREEESEAYDVASAPVVSASPAPKKETVEDLKKYKELLDAGAITEAEFNEKKNQILGI